MNKNPIDPYSSLPVFGTTRTRIAERYALISSDGFVPSVWPGASGVEVVFHITPAMGAGFVQARLTWNEDGTLPLGGGELERFVFVLDGQLRISGAVEGELGPGGFAFLPAGGESILHSSRAVAVLFEKRFEPLQESSAPTSIVGNSAEIPSAAFLGNEGAQLKTLLPDAPEFDMAVNLFTYQPGAFLPFVETHIMEHGLAMVSGCGVYRLGDEWLPVREGDVIWMAPYCPQWFVAMGDFPASYLYYKNVNRPPAHP